MSDTNQDTFQINNQTVSLSELTFAIATIDELSMGERLVFVGESDTLIVAAEVNPDLLADQAMFADYVLPAVDAKIMEILQKKTGTSQVIRLFLEPGAISNHMDNPVSLLEENASGVVGRRPITENERSLESADGVAGDIIALFTKIVGQEPVMDEPFLDLGGDSIKVLEFLEKLQEERPLPGKDLLDMIEESTTLREIISWFEV